VVQAHLDKEQMAAAHIKVAVQIMALEAEEAQLLLVAMPLQGQTAALVALAQRLQLRVLR
jgi:hypothetical protein